MILVEKHKMKKKKSNIYLYNSIDLYCYASKNLRNATNYIINQCSRIHYKLKQGEIIDSWEKGYIYKINCKILEYNKQGNHDVRYIDDTNGYIADAYFLSWYLKGSKEYKEMPMATCSQICIQNLCKDWKSYYKSIKDYKKTPNKYQGKPRKPSYYDKELGRNYIVLTNQKIKVIDNVIILPKVFNGLTIKVSHNNIQQVRIKTNKSSINIEVLYKHEEQDLKLDKNRVMSIDLGVNNLATVTTNVSKNPYIINGKVLKSINQYYNKRLAELKGKAEICNKVKMTKRISRLIERRNNKVRDYIHKASHYIIEDAKRNNIGVIIVGKNQGWKREVNLGKKVNQSFVSIPFNKLIEMLRYKGKLIGIDIREVEENYTSGTSYLDNEAPIEKNYNKRRRVYRGLFRSNVGIEINADVNGSYQIMKKGGIVPPIKAREKVVRLKVA